jgi:hypothetical protein
MIIPAVALMRGDVRQVEVVQLVNIGAGVVGVSLKLGAGRFDI